MALPRQLDDTSRAFLISEYEHLGASLISNEEAGESRVNVFVGLIAAAIAGLGFAADALKDRSGVMEWVIVAGMAGLLVFGLATLRRVMERNLATTSYLNSLRLLRASYALRDPALTSFLPFLPSPSPYVRERRGWGVGKAGFLETVALANSTLAGIAVATGVVAQSSLAVIAIVGGLAAAAVLWVLQIVWATHVYRTETAREAGRRRKAVFWWTGALGRE